MENEVERTVKVKMRIRMVLVVWDTRLGERNEVYVDERTADLGEFEVKVPDNWVKILELVPRSFVISFTITSAVFNIRKVYISLRVILLFGDRCG